MGELQLPIESFPAWALLQDVEFDDVGIAQTPDKGYGLVSNKDVEQETIVLRVPRELLLSVDQVEQYVKIDSNFRGLLAAFGQQVYSDNATKITGSSCFISLPESRSCFFSSHSSSVSKQSSEVPSTVRQLRGWNIFDLYHTIYQSLPCGKRLNRCYLKGPH